MDEVQYIIDDQFYVSLNIWLNLLNYSLHRLIDFVSKIDGAIRELPYINNDFVVRREGRYIKFDHPNFVVYFDGYNFLKVRVCAPDFVGLCALSTNGIPYPFKPFIMHDAMCDMNDDDEDDDSLTTVPAVISA